MPFYPLFDIFENQGFIHLANFPPNNWEKVPEGEKNLFYYQTNGVNWEVRSHGSILRDELKLVKSSDLPDLLHNSKGGVRLQEVALFDMRFDRILGPIDLLPKNEFQSTVWPEWRSTIGFSNESSKVCYQGEVAPFSPRGSLLTFHPFVQFGMVDNYFVFLNIESSAVHRWADLEIYLSSGKFLDKKKVRNNAANIFSLDDYGLTPDDLPIFYCKNMAGIPFGFGVSKDSNLLSLEHTHPPSNLTLHGNRFNSQRDIKMAWVDKLINGRVKAQI